jgi:hypothetical protein
MGLSDYNELKLKIKEHIPKILEGKCSKLKLFIIPLNYS